MAIVPLLCGLSLLLGLHIGATWPWLAFLVRHPSRVQETSMTTSTTLTSSSPPPQTRRQLLVLTWLLIGTMAATFAVGVLMVIQRATISEAGRDALAYQRCQAKYSTQFQEAYKARADASIATTEAMDLVIKAVNRALDSGDGAALAAAVQNYLDVRRAQTIERRANPLPPLPEQVCGPAPTED